MGTWGSACEHECPGGKALPCAGHGQCLDGVAGSGLCVCSLGYALADCSAACPGDGVYGPCTGHGACLADTARCACHAGYAGPACAASCPRSAGLVCGGPGRGHCQEGPDGAGVCACAISYGGAACSEDCAGLGPDGPCSGHGRCAAADGTCTCDAHWAGAACGICAAGWHGVGCGLASHQGVGRTCVCHAGWAGPSCSAQCPGGAAAPCGGHGACNATHLGDGSCVCHAEWRGPGCAVPCPGLREGVGVCSSHGLCRPDATCACTRTASEGHWAGPLCDRCQNGFAGAACTQLCPRVDGVVCAGHGVCDDAGACRCYEGAANGFWDSASDCSDCLPGHWGPQCRGACPGSGCSVCSGHGRCGAGRAGGGACACDPQWEGPDCSRCAPAWYGPDCNASCPAGLGAGGTASRGGTEAASACAWQRGEGLAVGTAAWGTGAPGVGLALVFSLGKCFDGMGGNATCACDTGHFGTHCERSCPAYGGRVCNGIGACDTAAGGVCDCRAAVVGQYWAGTACEACALGFVGPRCDIPCPHSSPTGAVCGGAGVCHWGPPSAAVCACGPGHYGRTCQHECPGGAASPCSGHGACDTATGLCRCDRTAAQGHWAGAACGACAEGWSGAQCTMACPVGLWGLPCSGFPCREGACSCGGNNSCGLACDVAGPACSALTCPPGHYGPGCLGECPRTGPDGALCSGHRDCLAMVYGNGTCSCAPGYAGTDCARLCPGGASDMCAGHGRCDTAGVCHCHTGFAGPGCGIPCPRSRGTVCGGHGACRAADGRCVCAVGYANASCDALCPGFDPAAPVPRSCGGHGRCEQATARCVCDTSRVTGYWAGALCSVCVSGWYGVDCREECTHGHTRGDICVCDPGYGAPNCSVMCPGWPDNVCCGHGSCLDGNMRDGTCACDRDWYGPDCGVHCVAALTCAGPAIYPAPHPQCNPRTGACECQQNATGQWGGALCNACRRGFWGAACATPCDCNDNGGCGWLDGACECFADEDHGFWAGPRCATCQTGYLEPLCRARNVAISRPREVPVQAQGAVALVVDERHGLMYTGGRPLLVFWGGDAGALRPFSVGGTVRGGFVGAGAVHLVVEGPGGGRKLVAVRRGPSPAVLNETALTPAAAGRGGRGARRRAQPQAAAQGVLEVLEAHGVVYHFAFSGPGGSLSAYSPAGARLRSDALAAEQLQLDVVRGVHLQPLSPTRAVLVLGGAWAQEWQSTVLPLPPDGPPVPLRQSLAPQIPQCAAASPCTAAGGVTAVGTSAYLALEAYPKGVVLVHFSLTGLRVIKTSAVIGTEGMAGAVTAMAVDHVLGAVLVVMDVLDQPSVVFKVNATTLITYGTIRLRSRGGQPERIRGVHHDARARRMYALATVGAQPTLITLLLYAVIAVEPEVADVSGGTLLTVTGEGLVDLGLNATGCHFAAAGVRTNATVLSPSTVRCHAPRADPASEGCTWEALEVQLLPALPTNNGVTVRRVPTPTIRSVSPARGWYCSPQWVLVRGASFVPTPQLSCKFAAGDGHSVVVRGADWVQYRSSSEVRCRQPDMTPVGIFPIPSYFEISVDGQVFSHSLIQYSMVWPAASLVASVQALTLPADQWSPVPNVVYYTQDAAGHPLRKFDMGQAPLVARVTVARQAQWNATGDVTRFEGGAAAFPSLALERPRVGQYELHVDHALPLRGPPVRITVVEGVPVCLRIAQQPSRRTDGKHPLLDQPVLELEDAAGNGVKYPQAKSILARATATPCGAPGSSAFATFAIGQFEFRDIKVQVRSWA